MPSGCANLFALANQASIWEVVALCIINWRMIESVSASEPGAGAAVVLAGCSQLMAGGANASPAKELAAACRSAATKASVPHRETSTRIMGVSPRCGAIGGDPSPHVLTICDPRAYAEIKYTACIDDNPLGRVVDEGLREEKPRA